ncbi:MAG: NUDIX hydrolase [Nostocoides sp.]
MRVLLIDQDERLLLFQDSDRGLDPIALWWMTPGGGVDSGEADPRAAAREVHEETGLVVAEGDLIGPLATRTVIHGFSDVITVQDEVFWAVRCPSFAIDTSGHTADEQASITAHRWWSRAELAATEDTFWPADLLGLWDLADTPPTEPIDQGTIEESTVPA